MGQSSVRVKYLFGLGTCMGQATVRDRYLYGPITCMDQLTVRVKYLYGGQVSVWVRHLYGSGNDVSGNCMCQATV